MESGATEFKLSTGQIERGRETLCAFMNADGGVVVFDVDEDGKIERQ